MLETLESCFSLFKMISDIKNLWFLFFSFSSSWNWKIFYFDLTVDSIPIKNWIMNVNIYSYPPRLEKALILIPLSSVCLPSLAIHLLAIRSHTCTHTIRKLSQKLYLCLAMSFIAIDGWKVAAAERTGCQAENKTLTQVLSQIKL